MGRKKKFENRFEVVVETASRLFLQNGFEGTTMDDIAKACDLGKATIYAEFESKEDLMQAVIVRHVQNNIAKLKAKVNETQENYLEALHEILFDRVMGIYDRVTKHFYSVEVLMAARAGFKNKARVRQHREEEARIMANFLERAALNGEIVPSSNYFRLAKLIRKGLAGLYPPHIFDIPREEFEADAKDIIHLYLLGLTVEKNA